MAFFFFFSFRPFPSIRGRHSVLSFFKPSCFQRPSPLHQPSPFLLRHIQKFSPWSPSSPLSRQLHFHHPSSFLCDFHLFICFFVSFTVSSPYTIVGLITELYTFPFTLAGDLLLQITADAFLHPFHPACHLFFTSLSQPSLSCTVNPKYLNSFILVLLYCIFHLHCFVVIFCIYAQIFVFDLLTSIPLLSNAYLQDSSLCFTSSLVFSQITISSANSIVHDGSFFTSFVSLSIITANRNGLNADPWCSPTLTLRLSVVPTVLIFFYIFCLLFYFCITNLIFCLLCINKMP